MKKKLIKNMTKAEARKVHEQILREISWASLILSPDKCRIKIRNVSK